MSEMNVYQKIIEIRKTIPCLKKDGRNKEQSFDYTSSENTLESIRPALDKYGVLIVPQIKEPKVQLIEKQTKSGNIQTIVFTELILTYDIVNAENPTDRFQMEWYGQGIDYNGEKGVGKALTYAEKYLLMKLLNIPTGADDPDSTATQILPERVPVETQDEPISDDAKTKIRDLHVAISTLKGDEYGKGLYTATKKKHGVFTVEKATMTQARQIYVDLKKVYDEIKKGE